PSTSVGKRFSFAKNKHFNHFQKNQKIHLKNNFGKVLECQDGIFIDDAWMKNNAMVDIPEARLYNLNPKSIEVEEKIQIRAEIASNGAGIVNTLENLKTGDREDLFDAIEQSLIFYIPSIEKLSFRTSEPGKKSLQVREKGIEKPFSVAELSEGTKLILMILTILHQENPPKLILLEDIDRGLHPRLFQKVVEMLRDIVKTKDIQIIATTHNPYLIDEFTGEEESVLIVEKQDAVSTITSLAERLDEGNTMEDALGSLWFSGFFGGVPKS
ncbi:MAG: AAA family ATPase, partial [Cyanobacteria bacterium P01_F01_bin.143]